MASKILDKQTLQLLCNAANAAKNLGINSISIETNDIGNMIRGFSDDTGSPVVFTHTIDGVLPFKALAISNCALFLTKLNLADKADPGYTITASLDDNSLIVTDLEFKGKKFKLKFNSARPDAIKAPKGIKDIQVGKLILSKSDIENISNGVSAMGAEYITVVYDGSDSVIEIRGATDKEVFSFQTEGNFVPSSENKAFTTSYLYKTIAPAIKLTKDGEFGVTSRGLLVGNIRDINFSLFPRKV